MSQGTFVMFLVLVLAIGGVFDFGFGVVALIAIASVSGVYLRRYQKSGALSRLKQTHDSAVFETTKEFEENKLTWKQISEKKTNNIVLTEEDKVFLKKWKKVKKNYLKEKFDQDKEFFVMYQEWCKINGLPCNWSSAKTVDDSRKLLATFMKSVNCPMTNLFLMIGIGNNGQNNNSASALIAYFMERKMQNCVYLFDGDSFSGRGFDENAIVRNVADVTRRMWYYLGGYMYMRLASTALNASMSFSEFHDKHGGVHYIELCRGKLDESGNVVYGGDGHIFYAKYRRGDPAKVVVWGYGDIGKLEMLHAIKMGYCIIMVSSKQLRNGVVVERNVYEDGGIPNYQMEKVSMISRSSP